MKQNRKLNCRALVLLAFCVCTVALQAKDYEFEKRYNKSFQADEVTKLIVDNKHGNVVVKDNGSLKVTIDVVVTIESSNARDGQELLDKVTIEIDKQEGIVTARTFLAKQKGFKFLKSRLEINYTINIPDTKALDVKNYYGNISIDRLRAPGRIEAKYGALYAGELLFPEGELNRIYIGYGRGEIDKVSTADIDIEYSKFKLTEGDKIDLDCQYSGVRLGHFKHIKLDAQFDGVDIASVETIDANCNYAGLDIGQLKESIRSRSSFGGVNVSAVGPDFELVDVVNSYGSIKIGLPSDTPFNIDLDAGYGKISIPNNWNVKVSTGMNSKEVRGNIRGASDRHVELNVSFGGIHVWEY